ncbi:MAG: hypothetical protein P4L22_03580 [Candidatus Babeliales bacterium]|nr:hypothetical protein [Candidatus Babeliales bacterium]
MKKLMFILVLLMSGSTLLQAAPVNSKQSKLAKARQQALLKAKAHKAILAAKAKIKPKLPPKVISGAVAQATAKVPAGPKTPAVIAGAVASAIAKASNGGSKKLTAADIAAITVGVAAALGISAAVAYKYYTAKNAPQFGPQTKEEYLAEQGLPIEEAGKLISSMNDDQLVAVAGKIEKVQGQRANDALVTSGDNLTGVSDLYGDDQVSQAQAEYKELSAEDQLANLQYIQGKNAANAKVIADARAARMANASNDNMANASNDNVEGASTAEVEVEGTPSTLKMVE